MDVYREGPPIYRTYNYRTSSGRLFSIAAPRAGGLLSLARGPIYMGMGLPYRVILSYLPRQGEFQTQTLPGYVV